MKLPRLTGLTFFGLLLVLTLPLAGCAKGDGDGSGSGSDTVESVPWEFEDEELGVQVKDLDLEDREDLEEDEVWYCDATVVVGGATAVITIEESDWPLLADENDVDTVTDYETGNERIYEADQALENFVVRDGDELLTILVNADDTWDVDGEEAEDAEEAAFLALQSPIIADASLHGLAALYGLMSRRAEQEAPRTVCQSGGTGGGCWGLNTECLVPVPGSSSVSCQRGVELANEGKVPWNTFPCCCFLTIEESHGYACVSGGLEEAEEDEAWDWDALEEQEDDVVEILRETIRQRLEDESDDSDE